MKSVVIVGANFAGLSAASQLASTIDVKVIDSQANFEWTPNIHEILSGVKQETSVFLERPKIVARLGHQFIQKPVLQIDPEEQRITLADNSRLAFDACLLAPGLSRNNHGVSGAEEYAENFRTAQDVTRIRSKVEALCRSGKAFSVTVVGGGFTGIEALGELLRRYRKNSRMSIRVIERDSRLLAGQPAVIAEDITRLCQPFNVDIRCGVGLKQVTRSSIVLDTGEKLESDLTIWTAGTKIPEFVRNSGLQLDAGEMVEVQENLQTRAFSNVFAAGDVAGFSPALSKQAYHALDMGSIAGRNINRYLKNQPMRSFVPADKPIALAFGDLNTYLIQQQTVFASPLLATAKEAVYQLYMTQLSRSLPLQDIGGGLLNRAFGSMRNLLIPEVSRLKILDVLRRSKVLQWGGLDDIEAFSRAMLITATR